MGPDDSRSGPLSKGWAWDVATTLLPVRDRSTALFRQGGEHIVVVVPGAGVVRISRARGAEALARRRTELLSRLALTALPFAVPELLSEVTLFDGHAAVALSWLPGTAHPRGHGDPRALADVLAALRAVDTEGLVDALAPAHGYAGGERWAQLMQQAVAELPADVRSDAQRRLDAALSLPEVPPSLVHGDLGGANMHWDEGGKLIGVLDWDWAAAWDPAVDAGCLSWHGWAAVEAAVDPATLARARAWEGTFVLEQVVASWLRSPARPGVLERAAEWLRRGGRRGDLTSS